MSIRFAAAAVSAVLILGSAATSAHAACTTLGFLVNDYGKEGPSRDAQQLLDKHIVQWTAERGIKKYTVGKKSVTCELFLDFIVFDEYTCTAEAPVCIEGKTFPEPLPENAKTASPAVVAKNDPKARPATTATKKKAE